MQIHKGVFLILFVPNNFHCVCTAVSGHVIKTGLYPFVQFSSILLVVNCLEFPSLYFGLDAKCKVAFQKTWENFTFHQQRVVRSGKSALAKFEQPI